MPINIPLCTTIAAGGETPCIRVVGATLCASVPGELPPSPLSMMRSMLGQLNSVLAPTKPIFTLLDAAAAIFEAIKGLATLDPLKIADALETLTAAMAELLGLLPQFTLPVLLKDVLGTIATLLDALAQWLGGASNAIATVAESEVFFEKNPKFDGLLQATICQTQRIEQSLASASEGLTPINSLISATNALLEAVGLGAYGFPDLSAFTIDSVAESAQLLRDAADVMRQVADLIPG